MNISFIVPAFNCAGFLPETIASIYDNNFESGDEVIIVNDASTDDTLNVIYKLQAKYPGIKTFSHHINKGSAAASRNTGIDNSHNSLLFCLDADNILTSGSIKHLKKLLINKNADAAAFGEIRFFLSESGKYTHKWILKEKISLFDCINNVTQTPCSGGNYLFTKKSWKKAGRYIESTGGAYDSWAFAFNQLAKGCEMVTLPETYYLHRHGYESTFIKDVGIRNTSITILGLMLPFLQIFHPDDVNYIMSESGRHNWFEQIDKRPIRLKEEFKSGFLKKTIRKARSVISQKR